MNARIWIVVASVVVACGQKKERAENAGAGSQTAHLGADARTGDHTGSGSSSTDNEPQVPPPAPTVTKSATGDCKTEYAPKPARDPNPMCKIDGGTFMMGAPASDKEALANERPQRRVEVEPFYLDQFEVTIAQAVHYLNSVAEPCDAPGTKCFDWGGTSGLDRRGGASYSERRKLAHAPGAYRAEPGVERQPYEFATHEGAARYCAWAGKRLPREAEWEYAAKHDPKSGKDLAWPWGNKFERRRANCGEWEGPTDSDGFGRKAPVGSFDGTSGRLDGSSPFGVHDLVCNAGELVAGCYGEDKPGCEGVLRQSSFASDRVGARPTIRQSWNGEAGFRCARDL